MTSPSSSGSGVGSVNALHAEAGRAQLRPRLRLGEPDHVREPRAPAAPAAPASTSSATDAPRRTRVPAAGRLPDDLARWLGRAHVVHAHREAGVPQQSPARTRGSARRPAAPRSRSAASRRRRSCRSASAPCRCLCRCPCRCRRSSPVETLSRTVSPCADLVARQRVLRHDRPGGFRGRHVEAPRPRPSSPQPLGRLLLRQADEVRDGHAAGALGDVDPHRRPGVDALAGAGILRDDGALAARRRRLAGRSP